MRRFGWSEVGMLCLDGARWVQYADVETIIVERDQLHALVDQLRAERDELKEVVAAHERCGVNERIRISRLFAENERSRARVTAAEAERDQQAGFVNEWRTKAFAAKDDLNKAQARVRWNGTWKRLAKCLWFRWKDSERGSDANDGVIQLLCDERDRLTRETQAENERLRARVRELEGELATAEERALEAAWRSR